jgi:hypothetical protein
VNPLRTGITIPVPFGYNYPAERIPVSGLAVTFIHPLRQIHTNHVFAFDSHRPAVCPNTHHVTAIITAAARHPIDTIIVKNLR